MIQFQFMGVHVHIPLTFWICVLLFGEFVTGAITKGGMENFILLLLFALCLFISCFFAAFIPAKIGKGKSDAIALVKFGWIGATYHHLPGIHTKKRFILTTLSGPVTSFLLLGLFFSLDFLLRYLHPEQPTGPINFFLYIGVVINFVLSVVSILPIFPFEGGRILLALTQKRKMVHIISLIVLAVAIALCLYYGRTFGALFCGYMAYINYQQLKPNENN